VDIVLKDCHEPPYVGHMGVHKTLDLVRRHIWWRGWREDVTQYIRECYSCQCNKPLTGKPIGPLQPLEAPEEPWESVSMDFMVRLPKTMEGHDTVLVYVCRLTKMVHLVPMSGTYTAKSCAEAFVQNVWRLHGLPKSFVSDRDKVWTGEFHEHLCHLLGIERRMSTAYHPESDGQVERMNRVVQQVLRHFVSPRATNWDKLLPLVEFAINQSKQESTGFSPFQLNYGRNPASPLDREIADLLPRKKYYGVLGHCPTAIQYHENWKKMLQLARMHIKKAQDRQKSLADQRRSEVPPTIAVGKKVWLSTANLREHMAGCQKFMRRYIGPFQILEEIRGRAFRLELPENMKIHPVFHVSLLKPYVEGSRPQPPPPEPEWVDGEQEWRIGEILAHRCGTGPRARMCYQIRWEGYGPEHDSWEPETNILTAEDDTSPAITKYWQSVLRDCPKDNPHRVSRRGSRRR